jgi:hypothetical protein
MKVTFLKVAFIALFGLGGSIGTKTFAQSDGKGRLEDAEIVVEKDRVIELPEASRNFQKIAIDPPTPRDRAIDYNFNDYRLPNQDIRLAMRVLTVKQEPLPHLDGNYIKAGVGNFLTGYLKGHFHNTRSKDYNYGADISHLSSGRGPIGVPGINYSGVSNSRIALNGEAFMGDVTLGGKLNYGRDQHFFYGFNPEILNIRGLEKDTIRQVFNRIGAQTYVKNNQAESLLQYNLGLGFDFVRDAYNARESNVQVNLASGYALDKFSQIRVDGNLSLVNYTDEFSQSRTFFRLRPTYERDMDLLKVTVGATIAYTSDTVNSARQFNFYPAIRAGFEAIDKKLILFAGLEGDLTRVTLNNLTRENPFLAPNLRIADTNKGLDVYAGFTGNITKEVQLTGRVAYQSFRNLYFYNPSMADSSRFDLVYDDGTTNVLNIHGELIFNASEKVRVGVKGDYNSYSLTELERPFHRPALQATAFGTVNIGEKIFLNSELYYISSTYAQVFRPQTNTFALRQTDTIIDLNVKGDYRFSKNFSSFVMANNLFAQQYQRYLNYPGQGLNIIGGITYSF